MVRTSLRLTCALLVGTVLAVVTLGVETSSAQLGYVRPPFETTNQKTNGQSVKLTVTFLPGKNDVQIVPAELPPSAFTVREHKAKLPVTVEHLGGDQLEMAIVVDTERGATDLDTVRAAATNLVDRVPDQTRVAIIAASPKPAVLSPMGADRQVSGNGVNKLVATDSESVMSAIPLAVGQFSSRPNVRHVMVLLTGSFATTNLTVRQVSDVLTNASVDSYVIQTHQSTIGIGFTAYPLPVGAGRALGGLDADMLPLSGQVLDQLFRQYRLSFRVREKIDPIAIHIGVQALGKSYDGLVFVRLHLLPPATGHRSVLSLALQLGAIALAVALVLALLFVPARWARARFAKAPVRPLLPPGSEALRSATGPAPGARAAAPPLRARDLVVPSRVTAVRPGPGLGGEQVEGAEAVRELLRAQRRQVRTVWLAEDVIDPMIDELAERARVPVRRALRGDIESASYTKLADGVLAHAAPVAAVEIDDLGGSSGPMSVMLVDHMADASLGALIRTGVSCGVTGVVLPRQRLNPISPTTTAVARGAIESVEMVLASSLPAAVTRLRANKFLVVGIEADAPGRLLDLELDFAKFRVVLAIDGRGQLDDLIRARCDMMVGVDHSSGVPESAEVIGQRACIELARRRIPGAVH